MKHKITIEIDEITSRQAGQLAAWKGVGFREYLAAMLEAGLMKYVKQIDTGEACVVTLEIRDDLHETLECYSGSFYDEAAAAKHFITSEVAKEWRIENE